MSLAASHLLLIFLFPEKKKTELFYIVRVNVFHVFFHNYFFKEILKLWLMNMAFLVPLEFQTLILFVSKEKNIKRNVRGKQIERSIT